MEKNNLFSFATKELSQDAMFCWLINGLNSEDCAKQALGQAVMDLFLGENKQQHYSGVKVIQQLKRIDVLILYNQHNALILEDKTNTSEHHNQIEAYRNALADEKIEGFELQNIHTVFVKTGVMYDEDTITSIGEYKRVDNVVGLSELLLVLAPFTEQIQSEILNDYVAYLQKLSADRKDIDLLIEQGKYSEACKSAYGQFSFLDRIFDKRSKGTAVARQKLYEKDEAIPKFIDYIYAGTNIGGRPWTQYCFWGQQYTGSSTEKSEYHYLFWRVDCKWVKVTKDDGSEKYDQKFYLALRHFDENTKSKNESNKERKKKVYEPLFDKANKLQTQEGFVYPKLYEEIGERSNYKESDLIFMYIDNLKNVGSFDEIKSLILRITAEMIEAAEEMPRF